MIDRLCFEQSDCTLVSSTGCPTVSSNCEVAKILKRIFALSLLDGIDPKFCSLPRCESWRTMCSQSLSFASTCVCVLAVHLGFILLTLILCLKFSEEMTQLPMPYKLFCPEEARIKEDGGKRQAFQICIVCEPGPGPRSGLTFEIY